MKPLKIKLSVTIDEDIVVDIRELAEKDDRSVSQYINLVLRDYLNRRNELTNKKK